MIFEHCPRPCSNVHIYDCWQREVSLGKDTQRDKHIHTKSHVHYRDDHISRLYTERLTRGRRRKYVKPEKSGLKSENTRANTTVTMVTAARHSKCPITCEKGVHRVRAISGKLWQTLKCRLLEVRKHKKTKQIQCKGTGLHMISIFKKKLQFNLLILLFLKQGMR